VPQQGEADGGGAEVRREQHRGLDRPGGRRRYQAQHGQRTGRQDQRHDERDEPADLLAHEVAPRPAEGEPPVGLGVGHRGGQERETVGSQRVHDRAQRGVQDDVRHGARDPDGGEPHHLADQAGVREPGHGPTVGPKARSHL
jgi:hypothetical protein